MSVQKLKAAASWGGCGWKALVEVLESSCSAWSKLTGEVVQCCVQCSVLDFEYIQVLGLDNRPDAEGSSLVQSV